MIDPASDLALARAVDDLRRGEIIRVTDEGQGLDLLAAELATPDRLQDLERDDTADLLITPERAATLKILNQRAAAGAAVVAITRRPWHDLLSSLATADPVDDLATPFKGPFPTHALGSLQRAGEAAVALAKRAALLPALFAVPVKSSAPDRAEADAAAVLGWRRAPRLQIVSRARLPLAFGAAEPSPYLPVQGA